MTKKYWYGLNVETNPIGFGCWQISGNHFLDRRPNGWGNVTSKDALYLIRTAIDFGIDFFDTAQGYNSGQSERILGQAIKGSSKDVLVCTKIQLTEEELSTRRLGNDFYQRVETSLNNLKKEAIDILLIHNPPDDLDWYSFDFQKLDTLVEQGKIRAFGVSSKSIFGAEKVVEAKFGTVLEWIFNIFERRPEKTLFPLLDEYRINFIARSPLASGLINPEYLETYPFFDKNDFRTTLPKEWIDWTLDSLRKFHLNGTPSNEIIKQAILYCVSHQTVKSCIVGIKTINQLEKIISLYKSLERDPLLINFNFEGIPEHYPKW